MSQRTKYISISIFGLLLLLSYQNCGKKMQFSSTSPLTSSLGGDENSGDTGAPIDQGEFVEVGEGTPVPPKSGGDEVVILPPPGEGEVVDHTEEDILPACQQGNLQVREFEVNFGRDDRICDWSVNGNLARRNEFIQARREQIQTLSLPAGATLCDMEFEFSAQGMWYDDHLIFTLNDRVLMSTERFDNSFVSDAAGPIYDWSRIAGADYAVGETHIFCNGSASTCELPSTDTKGTGQMAFPKSLFQKIMAVSPQRDLEFKVVTTGDNDDATDCKHDPFAFKIKAYYR